MNLLKYLLPLITSNPTLAPGLLRTAAGAIRTDPALIGQLLGHLPASPVLTTLTPILSGNPGLVADILETLGAQLLADPAYLTGLLAALHVA